MRPEEKLELLRMLLERNAEVRTYYRNRRVVVVEKADSQVVIRYEDGDIDKITMQHFTRRRFVVVL